MNTINSIIEGEFEAKGSRFLSSIIPFCVFESHLCVLKTKHAKARHFVFAARFLNQNNQICEKSSDDGEPKGSGGIPTLNVLRGEKLNNVAIITTRYFGGVLLGVGGLVKSYTNAAKNAIQNAKAQGAIIPFMLKETITLLCPYTHFNALEYAIKSHNLTITTKDFLANEVRLNIEGIDSHINAFCAKLDFHINVLESSSKKC